MHPRVTSFSNFNFHESSWRAQTDATNAMIRAQVLKSFTLKFQQSNKCLWGNKRGRTTKELQELDPIGSPHLEEILISGNMDLDLLSLFPQRYARILGGIERGQGFPRSTMVGEREKTCWNNPYHFGEEGGV